MISMNQVIAGGQPMQWSVSVRPIRDGGTTAAAPAPAPAPQEPTGESDATANSATGAAQRPGRAHIQQDVHHLAKAVRTSLRAEMQEMKRAGTWTPEQAAAVREMGQDFLAEMHQAVKDAGRGRDFDGGKVPEGVRQAMISLTGRLAAFNGPRPVDGGTADVSPPAPVGDGAKPGQTDELPTEVPSTDGVLVDTWA